MVNRYLWSLPNNLPFPDIFIIGELRGVFIVRSWRIILGESRVYFLLRTVNLASKSVRISDKTKFSSVQLEFIGLSPLSKLGEDLDILKWVKCWAISFDFESTLNKDSEYLH